MHTAKLPEITLHGATFSSVCMILNPARLYGLGFQPQLIHWCFPNRRSKQVHLSVWSFQDPETIGNHAAAAAPRGGGPAEVACPIGIQQLEEPTHITRVPTQHEATISELLSLWRARASGGALSFSLCFAPLCFSHRCFASSMESTDSQSVLGLWSLQTWNTLAISGLIVLCSQTNPPKTTQHHEVWGD